MKLPGVVFEHPLALLLDHSAGELERMALAQLLEHRLLAPLPELPLAAAAQVVLDRLAQGLCRLDAEARCQLVVELGQLLLLDRQHLDPKRLLLPVAVLPPILGALAGAAAGQRQGELVVHAVAAELHLDRLLAILLAGALGVAVRGAVRKRRPRGQLETTSGDEIQEGRRIPVGTACDRAWPPRPCYWSDRLPWHWLHCWRASQQQQQPSCRSSVDRWELR